MEKRHEDYYRLISSERDRRRPEAGMRKRRGYGGRGIRREREGTSFLLPRHPSLPLSLSLDLTPSVRPGARGDREMNDGKSSVGKLAEQR